MRRGRRARPYRAEDGASYRIDPSRIIYWASSGAALGAATAAIKSGSVAVLVNPQLDDRLGNSRFALEVARTFGVSTGTISRVTFHSGAASRKHWTLRARSAFNPNC